MTDLAGLRDRLLDMRERLLVRLAESEVIEPAWLALAANATVVALSLEDPDLAPARAPEDGDAGGKRGRGGDPKARARAERNAGLRDLASLVASDLSADTRARIILGKVGRYQPAVGDDSAGPERQALARIAGSGVPVPGKQRLRKILSGERLVDQKSFLDDQPAPPASEQAGGHECESTSTTT